MCRANNDYCKALVESIDDFAFWNLIDEALLGDMSFIEDFVAMFDMH